MDHRQRLLPDRGRRRRRPRDRLRAARRGRGGCPGDLHPRRLHLRPLDLPTRPVLSKGHRASDGWRRRHDPRPLQPGSRARVEPRPPARLLAPRRRLLRPRSRYDRPVHGHRARGRPDSARHLQDRIPRVQVRLQPLVLHGGHTRSGRRGYEAAGPRRVPVRPHVRAHHPAPPPAVRRHHDRRRRLRCHRRRARRPHRHAQPARRSRRPRGARTGAHAHSRPQPLARSRERGSPGPGLVPALRPRRDRARPPGRAPDPGGR